MRFVFACICAVLLTASTASAQFDTAAVVGTVRDGSAAVVPGAKVTLTGVETGISVVRTAGLLATGVKLGGLSLTTGNMPRKGAFNVNGLRSTFNNFLIDGVDNNAYGLGFTLLW